jgi:hypothetical protein
MLAYPKTRLSKKTYFVIGNSDLYYVIDILPDESQYLIEDCKTLKITWMDAKDCELNAKEVRGLC